MDLERAFRRREALQRRLAAIERDGFRWAALEPRIGFCPIRGHGRYSAVQSSKCPNCDGLQRSGVSLQAQPDIDVEDVIDPLTLEPVDPHDRDGYKRPGLPWDFVRPYYSFGSTLA